MRSDLHGLRLIQSFVRSGILLASGGSIGSANSRFSLDSAFALAFACPTEGGL